MLTTGVSVIYNSFKGTFYTAHFVVYITICYIYSHNFLLMLMRSSISSYVTKIKLQDTSKLLISQEMTRTLKRFSFLLRSVTNLIVTE